MKRFFSIFIVSILIFNICIMSVSAEVDIAGDGSSGDSSSCSVEVGCNYTDSGWYRGGANCLDVFTATFSTSTPHDVAAYVFMTPETAACNSYQVMGNPGVSFKYVNTRSYSGHSVADRNETLTVAEEQGVLTQQSSIFNACYYNLTVEDNSPKSWITGVPLFKTQESCIEYLNTGVINEDELVSFDTFDNEADEVLLSEDELIPPTDIEFKHNDILQCAYSASQFVGFDKQRLTSSWVNRNVLKDSSIELKTEIQLKGSYYYSNSDEYESFTDAICGNSKELNNGTRDFPTGFSLVSTDWYTLKNDELFTEYDFYAYKDILNIVGYSNMYDTTYSTYFSKNNIVPQVYHPLASTKLYINLFDVSESYRVRYYYILDGKKYVSNWVEFGADYSGDKTKKDEYTTVTDNEGNDTESDYYDSEGNSTTTGTDSEVKDTTSFWGWLKKQIDGISNVFSSIVNLFNQAKNAGTSFVDLFTAYNKWLPSSVMSLIVIGVSISVFLRIVGR